jgi:hypothetical protein
MSDQRQATRRNAGRRKRPWELIMIEIVLSVCMLADPAKCKDVHLSYAAESTNITPQQCMMNGQPEIAKWSEGNPNWQIQKWRCGAPRALAKA